VTCSVQPDLISLRVDDDGVGGGVTDILLAKGYSAQAVRAGTVACASDDYPNRRSELWFHSPSLAREGKLSLARLPRDVLAKLRQQAMAPLWKQDSKGRRVVESRAETKKRLGRSPDEMDAVNLALAPSHWFVYRSVQTPPSPNLWDLSRVSACLHR